ncbi:hypothetical protein [Stenotrophomonas sp. NRRL B-14846]|uniref:hypothetical protein n=1 Tax=Stenotrophomonas sp. NRRL B-14846 TaxID=3162882 RepID=UPI003D2E393B
MWPRPVRCGATTSSAAADWSSRAGAPWCSAGNNSYSGATRIERGILSLQNGGVIRSNVTILGPARSGFDRPAVQWRYAPRDRQTWSTAAACS